MLTLNSLHKFVVTEEWILWTPLGGLTSLPGSCWGQWPERREEKKEKECVASLQALGGPFPAPPAGTRRFLLGFSLFLPTPVLGFRLTCAQTGGHCRKKIMGRLTTGSVVLQLLVFFFSNVPTNIDFSESSDRCSVYSIQVLQLYSVGETGWSALTPFYPEPEPKDFFRHMKLQELITSRSSLQKKMLKEVFQTGGK